ncbi:hypothetical protein F6V30_10005 [Oryzomonas sagensis]|uniref:Uncharacterized protein n=1 Tax=Oryzomonas sagensis TaxID=2603857 RepID=A0ABQ6TPB2_9BACT|nr:hypothetical protein [Oryzomonas sagensis]KAB0670469.1 hypothetical protein F6V30_10005 [Oryzomonas sagensis]
MQAHHQATPRLFLAAAVCALLSLLLAPLPARAENVLFLQAPDQQLREQPAPQLPAAKKALLTLNDDGNVMVRYNNGVSLTFSYEAGGSPQESRIKAPPPRQEVASLGGLSVRFGVAF